jgi:HlyD family secretion protein
MTKRFRFLFVVMMAVSLLFSSCAALENLETGTTQAPPASSEMVSGTFTAYEVAISTELGGSVKTVNATTGDRVQAGQPLVELDSAILDAQINVAETAVSAAVKGLESAKLTHREALLQQELLARDFRSADIQQPVISWADDIPKDFDLPNWYFNRGDILRAATKELNETQQNLEVEINNLNQELEKASNADVISSEQRLIQAQERYRITEQVLSEAKDTKDNKELQNAAQSQFDAAKAELEAAQLNYSQILSSSAAEAVREARGRLAVTQKQFDLTQERVNSLQSGLDRLEMQAADLQVQQASIGIAQAEVFLDQSEAALEVLKVQLDKYILYSPVNGIVLTRMIEPGEILNPGSDALIVGILDTLILKIYLPEEMYGQIKLGNQAEIQVDSYPGVKFFGEVVSIADQVEYTPRNVQTIEGRRSTVYAVDIRVSNEGLKLKPGMPGDVLIASIK